MIGLVALLVGAAIDAGVLIILLYAVSGESVEFGPAFLIALGISVAAGLLAVVLAAWFGLLGVVLAVVIAATAIGVAVSALLGVEIKRSFLIGALFMVAHILVRIGLGFMTF